MPPLAAHHLIFHKLTYFGMLFLLSGAGIYAPVPEEITLLTAGYLASLGLMQPIIAIPLALVGTLIGDSTLFFLAKTGAPYAEKLRERLKKMRLERTWIFTPEHPLRAVFFMRFVTGMRMISPIYAGFHDATWAGFLLTSFSALIILVPLVFGIGYYFNTSLEHFIGSFELLRHTIFIIFLAVVFGAMLMTLYRYTRHTIRKRKKAKQTKE